MTTNSATLPGAVERCAAAFSRLFGRETADLLRIASPVAAVALVNMAMSVTDTLMAASLGEAALAATAVGSDFYSLVFYLGVGILGGLAPLYAAAHAAGDGNRLRNLRTSGNMIAALIAAPAIVIVWMAPDYLGYLGIDPELLARGSGYTRSMALTLVPMLVVGLMRIRLVAIKRAGLLLRVTVAAVPLNALLNYVLMYGFGGWQGLGITGAGISSFVVACFTASVLVALAVRNGDSGVSERIDWVQCREVIRVGLPIGVATVSEVGVFLGATLYVATISVPDAAAHALAIRTSGVVYAISIGLQQAAMVQLARAEAHPGRHRMIMAATLRLSILAGVSIFGLVMMLAGPLSASLEAGSVDTGAAAIAVQLLMLLAVSEIFNVLGAASAGLMRGLRVTRPAMVFSLVGNWLIAAPIGLWLSMSYGMGAFGVWVGLALGPAVAAILTAISLRGHWKRAGSQRSAGTV